MTYAIPSHVPADLVVDFDMTNVPGGEKDMQIAWRKALAQKPLVYTPHNGGIWIFTTAEALDEFFPDVTRLSNHEIFIPAHEGERVLPGELDPPRHGDLRKAILARLTATVVRDLEPRIREFTIELIEGLRDRGECEFISEFALQLPIAMFLELAGMPQEDKDELHGLSEAISRGKTVEIKNAGHQGLRAYLRKWIEIRRTDPSEDLISKILEHRIDDQPLSLSDVEGLCMGIFLGGLDTVASSLGFIGRFLAENPAQRDYIRANAINGTQIVDELMRRFSIVSLGRIVAEDFEYQGVLVKKGDRVSLTTFLHGLDPTRFADPEKVDFDRRPANMAFGKGPHACPGRILARAELRIFLEEWLNRIPDFEIDEEKGFAIATGQVLAFKNLYLRWPIAARAAA